METYKTTDLYEASLLYAIHSQDFLGLEPQGSNYLFIFRDTPCRATAQDYYSRQISVNAKEYSDAIRTCKDMVFNRLRGHNR